MSEVKNNSVQSKGTVSKTAELEAKIASPEALLAKAESAITTLTSQSSYNQQPIYNNTIFYNLIISRNINH